MAKFLVVEDDQDIAEFIADKLVSLRHAVDHATSGDDAIGFVNTYQYDLIILDLNIPPPNGLEVLKHIRSTVKTTKVLMLTTQSAIEDRLLGFASGADDYLCKPFDLRELLARIEALLNRPTQLVDKAVKWGNLSVHSASGEVYRGDTQIRLQPRDFALLEFLMRHPNEVFSAEALINRCWDAESGSTDAVRVAVSRIRKAVDLPERTLSIIENVNRVGYKIGKVK